MTVAVATAAAASLASPARWQLTAASVTGRAHEKAGTPNQDSVEVLEDAEAQAIAAVVSDGAGSAPRSKEGSQATARTMAAALLLLARSRRLADMDAQHMHDWGLASLERLRQELRLLGDPLAQFHCTFVGMVLAPTGRWLLQLGDSAALVSRSEPGGDEGRVWFPAEATRLHAGSRGTYANETHFVTDADWSLHLTVERLAPDADAVLLMSDGAMDVAMSQGRVFSGFLPIVARSLYDTPERSERDGALASWLAHPQTYRNTGDDKTLVVALRQAASSPRVPAPQVLLPAVRAPRGAPLPPAARESVSVTALPMPVAPPPALPLPVSSRTPLRTPPLPLSHALSGPYPLAQLPGAAEQAEAEPEGPPLGDLLGVLLMGVLLLAAIVVLGVVAYLSIATEDPPAPPRQADRPKPVPRPASAPRGASAAPAAQSVTASTGARVAPVDGADAADTATRRGGPR